MLREREVHRKGSLCSTLKVRGGQGLSSYGLVHAVSERVVFFSYQLPLRSRKAMELRLVTDDESVAKIGFAETGTA